MRMLKEPSTPRVLQRHLAAALCAAMTTNHDARRTDLLRVKDGIMRLPSRPDNEQAFNRRFCAIVRQARAKAGLSQQSTADKLGLTRARYKQFETKSPLPPAYLVPFALLTDTNVGQLLHAAMTSDRDSKTVTNSTPPRSRF